MKKFLLVVTLFSAISLLTPALFAEDQSISFTLDQPAALYNKTLEPGTYYIRPVDGSLLNAVQLMKASGKTVGFYLVHPGTMTLAPAAQSTITLDQQAGVPKLTGFTSEGSETSYDFDSTAGAKNPVRLAGRMEHFLRRHV